MVMAGNRSVMNTSGQEPLVGMVQPVASELAPGSMTGSANIMNPSTESRPLEYQDSVEIRSLVGQDPSNYGRNFTQRRKAEYVDPLPNQGWIEGSIGFYVPPGNSFCAFHILAFCYLVSCLFV